MIDILEKLEKGQWGSRGGLNAPCIHGKLTNIQIESKIYTNKKAYHF